MATVKITQQAPATVRVYPPGDAPVVVQASSSAATVRVMAAGTQGPKGDSGTQPVRIDASNAATWILPHALGRVPMVQVFLASGELVISNVEADAAHVTVTHASPQSGFVLIN